MYMCSCVLRMCVCTFFLATALASQQELAWPAWEDSAMELLCISLLSSVMGESPSLLLTELDRPTWYLLCRAVCSVLA